MILYSVYINLQVDFVGVASSYAWMCISTKIGPEGPKAKIVNCIDGLCSDVTVLLSLFYI